MKKFLAISAVTVLALATYLTLSNSWIVPDINRWQARLMNENKYFPALTISILVLPPLLILLVLKLWLMKRKQKP